LAWAAKRNVNAPLADYTYAIEANPNFKLAHLHRAEACQQTGEMALAASDLRTLECFRSQQQG